MVKNKKEVKEMRLETQHHSTVLPLPVAEKKRLIQAEVNLDLFNAAQKEMEKKPKLKIREIMEWALKQFLLETNPKEAARLGIKVTKI